MKVVRGNQIEFIGASHEDPANPGVLKRVLLTRDETIDGRVQMINWARLPVGSEFNAHYHEDMQEAFVILDGNVEMTVNDQVTPLGAGDMILIDPEEIHKMRNVSDQDVQYLVVGISLGRGGQTVVVER